MQGFRDKLPAIVGTNIPAIAVSDGGTQFSFKQPSQHSAECHATCAIKWGGKRQRPRRLMHSGCARSSRDITAKGG